MPSDKKMKRQTPDGIIIRPSKKKKTGETAKTATARQSKKKKIDYEETAKWPSGRIVTLPPKMHITGLRNPNFHGCGKCRHKPSGCRSCALYDQKYPFVPSNKMSTMPRGTILADFKSVGNFSTPRPLLSGRGLSRLGQDAIWTTVKVDKSELDKGNFGVFATVDIPEGTVLIDPTVVLVARDSAYARAHFDEYDFVNVGQQKYILLREPELGMRSITFFTNEANHGEKNVGQTAHIEWRIREDNLVWKFNHSVKEGEEILVSYDRDL